MIRSREVAYWFGMGSAPQCRALEYLRTRRMAAMPRSPRVNRPTKPQTLPTYGAHSV